LHDQQNYEMNSKYLVVSEKRNLGVIIQNYLKCSEQFLKGVKSANKDLGIIKRSFIVLEKHVILNYKSTKTSITFKHGGLIVKRT